jgi:hypothetical protein
MSEGTLVGDWLWWRLGYLCGAFVVVKLLGTLWCFTELRRKWRSVPELWALDWLDIVYRVEHEFGVTLVAADFEVLPKDARAELTAGQLWEIVVARQRAAGATMPADGWARLAVALSEALNVRPSRIASGSRLYADLGMILGIE